MLLKIILLLTVVPLVELYILFQLAKEWGFGEALLLVIVTGVVGGWLARREGVRAFSRVQDEANRGILPADALLDSVLIFIAGAFLVTPGVLTDIAGLCLLLPPTRAVIRARIKRWLKQKMEDGSVHVLGGMPGDTGFEPISQEPPPGSPPMEDE
jgi:UPF0716 protein FxsA